MKLTQPGGGIVYLYARAVARIRKPLTTEHGETTVELANGKLQGVQEDIEAVLEEWNRGMIRAAQLEKSNALV